MLEEMNSDKKTIIVTGVKSGKALAMLIIDPELNETTGKYFDGTKEIKSSELSYNKDNRKDLWRASVELTKLKKTETILNLD